MPRMFVAIYPIPFQSEIVEIQKKLQPFFIGKMVEKENFHITLSFLGNVEENQLEDIDKKLTTISNTFPMTEIKLNGIELIPNEKFVRVIAIKTLGKDLFNLSAAIKKLIGGDVKPPHLTIGRVKKVKNKPKLINISKTISLDKQMVIDSIKLMKSKLTRNGPIYTVVKSYNLSK